MTMGSLRKCRPIVLPLLGKDCRYSPYVERIIKHLESKNKWNVQKKKRKPKKEIQYNYLAYKPLEYSLEAPSMLALQNGQTASPKFHKILKSHELPRILPKPKIIADNRTADKFHDPTAMDFINSKLASYLRDVMESNSIINEIYGIDFYYNYDLREMAAQILFQSIDLLEMARLLNMLGAGEQLSDAEMAKIRKLLESLGNLGANQRAYYMHLLIKIGALSPDILLLLTQLLLTPNLKLSDSNRHILTLELEYQAEVAEQRAEIIKFFGERGYSLTSAQISQLMLAFEEAGGWQEYKKSGKSLVHFLDNKKHLLSPELKKLMARIGKESLSANYTEDNNIQFELERFSILNTLNSISDKPEISPTIGKSSIKQRQPAYIPQKMTVNGVTYSYYSPWYPELRTINLQNMFKFHKKGASAWTGLNYNKGVLEYYQKEIDSQRRKFSKELKVLHSHHHHPTYSLHSIKSHRPGYELRASRTRHRLPSFLMAPKKKKIH